MTGEVVCRFNGRTLFYFDKKQLTRLKNFSSFSHNVGHFFYSGFYC